MGQGLTIERRFTTEGQDVYDTVEWSRRDSRITNPDGSIVFEMLGAEVPAQWSQVAADIMVSKYFRKAGVPQFDDDGNPILDGEGNPVTGPEHSARQVIKRLASTWRWWGENNGYFATEQDADDIRGRARLHAAPPDGGTEFALSGSTPASTTNTGSQEPPRASGTSTRRPMNSLPRTTPTAGQPRMHASSTPSTTTW